MESRQQIRSALRRLGRRLRVVRAVVCALRFLVLGAGIAILPLALKSLLPGDLALWLAATIAGASAILGLLVGLLLPLRPGRVALLADRQLQLKERLTSAEEHLRLARATEIAEAQIAETAVRVHGLRARRAFPFRVPRETPALAPLALLAATLALLPALPLRLPTFGEGKSAEPIAEELAEKPLEQKLATPSVPEVLMPKAAEKDVQRGPLSPHLQQGDLAAVFKDTKVSEKRPDFGSFVKQGDDRMKLLAKPEAMPELSRDVTESPYQVMIRRMQEQLRAGRLQGLSWDQIERLLSEMGERQQQAGGEGLPDDLMQELERQGAGSPDKMLSALSRALNRLRDKGAGDKGKGRGLKEAASENGKGDPGSGEGDAGRDDGAPGGSKPGTEPSLQTRGDPSERIGGDKQEATLDGDPRDGRKESYDTNLSGRGADTPSRLPYLNVFSRYRRMMEEALTKEPIPFNYREQVKTYFQSLERRQP